MKRTEEELRLAQIDELWRVLVPGHDGKKEDRNIAAVRALSNAAEVMRSNLIAREEKENSAGYILAVFQLIAADLLDWVPSYFSNSISSRDEGLSARCEAIYSNFHADCCIQPQFRAELQTVLIALSRPTFELLREGLRALDHGETQPIFEPSFNHRQGDTWSWDQARINAVEHVMFLCGQDIPKLKARERVARAMGCVSAETLKSWEERDLKRHLPEHLFALAKAAGALYVRLEADPTIWSEEHSADAHTVHAMRSLKGQLTAFGRAYAELHGDRHRSRP